MNFKRFLCLALILVVSVVALAACGEDPVVEPKQYTVTFDSAGGSSVSAISVPENDKAIEPQAPEKTGYTFLGWYNGSAAYSFDTPVTANLTLTAKWEKTTYTVTFMDGSTKLDMELSSYDVESDDITLAPGAKEHYNFLGWYKDAAFKENIQKIEKGSVGNLTLYAQFKVKNYGINYHLYDGINSDGNPSSYNIESDFPVIISEPSKEGFAFVGWYTDANYTGEPVSEITELVGDVTLYAKWEELPPVESYSITYMDGENVLELTPSSYVSGAIVLLPRASKLQHNFLGWYTTPTFDEGTEIEAIAADATGDVTVYAKFEKNDEPDPEYTVSYFDGINKLNLEPTKYTSGTELALPLAEKEHYDFLGWYTTPTFDEGTKLEKIASNSIGDLTLYARFELKVYTITYYLEGGENAEGNVLTYTIEDQSFRFLDPTKEGHLFHGWYTDPNYKNQIVSLSGRSGDIVLYAKWVQEGDSGILTPEVPIP